MTEEEFYGRPAQTEHDAAFRKGLGDAALSLGDPLPEEWAEPLHNDFKQKLERVDDRPDLEIPNIMSGVGSRWAEAEADSQCIVTDAVKQAKPVDGSIHDRLMTMDVPRLADELHTALTSAQAHPWIPIIEEYMRELAGVAYEAGVMQEQFDETFRAANPAVAVMPEIADRECSFIENDAAGEDMGVTGDVERDA